MGAGCSSRKSTKIHDSITSINNLNTLSAEAQSHLKFLQQNQNINKIDRSEIVAKINKQGQEDDELQDKDLSYEKSQEITKHIQLWLAVELNDPKGIRKYLENYEETCGEELKETELYDSSGNSLLHKAASLGHVEVLMTLLERTHTTPDLVNSSLATPLHLACKNNRIDVAKFLIGCGVDANLQDEHGQIPLLICCIHGHFELAKMLIEASTSGHLPEPIEVDLKDHRGLSPLNCAAIKGDLKMTQMLVIQGGASIEGASPKGCTPLLYAARGGYAEVVSFLLDQGASPLRQDNAGGSVLHHAIEKGHMGVLNTLLEHGVDVHSAIEVPDNAGRTPIFEAIDNHDNPEILNLLAKPRKEGGFGAKVNIMHYNGQTPLFSAAREGNLTVVKALVEIWDAKIDLTQGEIFKDESDDAEEEYQSFQEKYFMEAYKNCMTPLHVATVLGHEEIMHYLIDKGANPNLQTKIKGYSTLHLAVLANKPEIIIELLTKTKVNPQLPDFGGRIMLDMIQIYIPSYLITFQTLQENLQHLKEKSLDESFYGRHQEESLFGLSSQAANQNGPIVVTHYYNPEDERSIQGAGLNADFNMYIQQAEEGLKVSKEPLLDKLRINKKEQEIRLQGENNDSQKGPEEQFHDMSPEDIEIEDESGLDSHIEFVFGKKIALGLLAIDWRLKEQAIRHLLDVADKYYDPCNKKQEQYITIEDMTRACAAAVGLTCKEKVMKVFSVSLQLLNLLVSSTKIEKSGATTQLKNTIVEKNFVLKLLQKSEEGNTRTTNKIHECLLDLSFNPEIGEALVSSFILQRILAHNRANAQKVPSKSRSDSEDGSDPNQPLSRVKQIEPEASLGSYRGLLAQLALLFKFINSFGIASKTRGPLSVKDILKSVVPSLQHPNQDVRNFSVKIILDVHKLSGCVNEEELSSLNEKTRSMLVEKLSHIKVEKNLDESRCRIQRKNEFRKIKAIQEEDEGEETDRAHVQETISTDSPYKKDRNQRHAKLHEMKELIIGKGSSKDWQEREVALKAIDTAFKKLLDADDVKEALEESFLQTCLILLKSCLRENNMTLYLLAIEVSSNFFSKAPVSEIVQNMLQSIMEPVVLRTTDTNTRVRRKSVDLINQIWDQKGEIQTGDKFSFNQTKGDRLEPVNKLFSQGACQIIASVICDPSLGEKAIIGRLGLFIKRAQQIEGARDLVSRPLHTLLGKNYEQLAEFGCRWISHKNTKVRQNALRLIVEICRINYMDPRGPPFKQRIVNYILGLRSSQRDPLIQKINEVCLENSVSNTSPGRANDLKAYIDLEAQNIWAANHNKLRTLENDKDDQSKFKPMTVSCNKDQTFIEVSNVNSEKLPTIGGRQLELDSDTEQSRHMSVPTAVLPHSEPLTIEQKQAYNSLIEYFGLEIVTCFISKNWATRLTAVKKVEEQLHNMDPSRRDAMFAEINRQNMPVEVSFAAFLEFMYEGLKDPVLKNYIAILELFQKAMPIYFRHIPPASIRGEIMHLIREIIRKTTDMKQKIRESSMNFCLYLSHQSPVGPEYMVEQVLSELNFAQNDTSQPKNKETAVAQNFGNSQLITSCLSLLTQYQTQTKIVMPQPSGGGCSQETCDPLLLKKFMDQINTALKHSNPQVRKEAEKLFRTLYCDFGQKLEVMLVNQKAHLVQKLIVSAKQEIFQQTQSKQQQLAMRPPSPVRIGQAVGSIEELNVQRAQDQIRDSIFNQAQLRSILQGSEEYLQALNHPNSKKKQKAIIEIKKAISKKIIAQLSHEKARELFEPLSILMRQLLIDDNPETYLESLGLLKFIVGNLAPNLSALDLHLMMGSFIGIIVQNTAVSQNIRMQVSNDKAIIFFARHKNIGPFLVAKEINQNIDRINQIVIAAGPRKAETLCQKKPALLRFYGVLHLLLQQFSIVLCYQKDFYVKCLECIADSILLSGGRGLHQEGEEVAIKSLCIQILNNLYAIDYKLLDQTVSKLGDINRKTPLRKAIIEHESLQKQGKNCIEMGKHANLQAQTSQICPIDPMLETAMSFASSSNRQSLFSPGSSRSFARGQSPGAFGASQYEWNGTNKKIDSEKSDDPEQPRTRRMISLNDRRNPSLNRRQAEQQSELKRSKEATANLTQRSWRRGEFENPSALEQTQYLNLNNTGILLPPISNVQGATSTEIETQYGFQAEKQKQTLIPTEEKPKHKLKSTGGAGFSSQDQSLGSKYVAGSSFVSEYEPQSATSRKVNRRTLGVLVNNSNGLGLGMAQASFIPAMEVLESPKKPNKSQISQPSQSGHQNLASNLSGTISQTLKSGASSFIGGNLGISIKPPLYVPSKRQASENNRKGTLSQPHEPSYVSKTGFKPLGVPPSG